MKTEYKYIQFVQGSEPFNGKPVWYIYTTTKKHDVLGSIFWYPRHKNWEFSMELVCLFDETCLADVIDFIKQVKDGEK